MFKKILDSNNHKAYITWYLHNGLSNRVSWCNVKSQKLVIDMWNYQEIITERNVTLIIECGARAGGSALFFYSVLKTLNRDFKILSIDIENQWSEKINFPEIIKLCDSDVSDNAITMMKELIKQTKGTVFVILDAKHLENHVKAELEAITPLLRPDDYLIVEDTVDREDTMRGMMNFMQKTNQYIFDLEREQKFGVSIAKHGFWIKRNR